MDRKFKVSKSEQLWSKLQHSIGSHLPATSSARPSSTDTSAQSKSPDPVLFTQQITPKRQCNMTTQALNTCSTPIVCEFKMIGTATRELIVISGGPSMPGHSSYSYVDTNVSEVGRSQTERYSASAGALHSSGSCILRVECRVHAMCTWRS